MEVRIPNKTVHLIQEALANAKRDDPKSLLVYLLEMAFAEAASKTDDDEN
ncbi:hypothetical protein [Pararhizobium haloflavum]|nr:hypothetical protein [Pararhizobium haloflavum]